VRVPRPSVAHCPLPPVPPPCHPYACSPFLWPQIPSVTAAQLEAWEHLPYSALAFNVLRLYIPEHEIPSEDLQRLVNKSYETFRHEAVVPVVQVCKPNTCAVWGGGDAVGAGTGAGCSAKVGGWVGGEGGEEGRLCVCKGVGV
jgi:hypothetical protein